LKINLQITHEDGAVKETTCNAADMVAFEDKFGVSISAMSNDPRMSYSLFLAWHSQKRTDKTKLTFEKWLESVDMVGAGSDPK
jgi:hypothetical protein|tara:strand:- start:78 stop:326 length:249 start_codon:yes stop_codon:yes gene_type:complete